jgi:hypothetical protein
MDKINKSFKSISLIVFFGLVASKAYTQAAKPLTKENTWTFTYIKASSGQHENVRAFLEKNWLVMDSVAVAQGLINKYELIENVDAVNNSSAEWDFIVAVEYLTRGTYADIADKFEVIRKQHQTIKIESKTLKEMASIIKSETVTKKVY